MANDLESIQQTLLASIERLANRERELIDSTTEMMRNKAEHMRKFKSDAEQELLDERSDFVAESKHLKRRLGATIDKVEEVRKIARKKLLIIESQLKLMREELNQLNNVLKEDLSDW